MQDGLDLELLRRRVAALHPVQPPLGLLDATAPRERGGTRGDGRSDDSMGPPSVRLGDRHGLLAELQSDGDPRAAQDRLHRKVAEAADLQVRPSDAASERQALLEVSAGVVQMQRPELGDAEVHQSRGTMVIVARACVGRLLL